MTLRAEIEPCLSRQGSVGSDVLCFFLLRIFFMKIHMLFGRAMTTFAVYSIYHPTLIEIIHHPRSFLLCSSQFDIGAMTFKTTDIDQPVEAYFIGRIVWTVHPVAGKYGIGDR